MSSEDFLDAVLVLNKSLQSNNSKYPLVCAVTSNIYNIDLALSLIYQGIIVEYIPCLQYSDMTQSRYPKHLSVLNTASKISIFDLKNYNKLCYIDADTIVMQNIDSVFQYPDGSMVMQDGQSFSGFFVFCPAHHVVDYYKTIMNNYDCFDGNLLSNLWFHIKTSPIHQISDNYFRQYNEVNLKYEDTCIWHFQGPYKPWIVEHHNYLPQSSVLQKYKEYLQLLQGG